MAAIVRESTIEEFSIGRVLARAVGTITRNPVASLGLAFLLYALPSAALNLLFVKYGDGGVPGPDPGAVPIAAFSIALMTLVAGALTQGALVRVAIADDEGARAGFGECLVAGLASAIPLIALSIVSWFVIGLGVLLLVVPGVIFWAMWSVAAPALVDESLGVFEALERSRHLTDGARWKIVGTLLVVLIASAILSRAIRIIIGVDSQFAASAVQQGSISPLGFVLSVAGTMLMAAFSSTVHAAMFVELRSWKEGPRTSALADVFA